MDFLVVDFEFSVPRSYGKPRAWFSEIIEVGAIVLDQNGKLGDKTYSAFVKPQFWPRLADESYGITGIRQEDVDRGVSLEEAISHLQELAPQRDSYLVAWGDADRKVLGSVCEKYGLAYPFIWDNYVDLAEEYKAYRSLDRLLSLKRAIEENGIEQIGILHSALDDAINAAQVMGRMMSEGWSAQINEENSVPDEKKIAESISQRNINIV
ncbi:inhibitor of the KinA pathway to sporulation, predicted exonuclease [Desulfitobacterium dichloroeliminans LMG P-21439]|uniref:Inhibitor of the KinA pathway to sporulation, predicted exonuclease n=1 Tax=Desulfitobacterium dichloroeliminans (strain LMG P-21439 / DCA1) TaxID=871963 RepID=L0F8G3_DESDL|nr:3'-5' exonuclease KapD [Desulfitobacterium dichloroeliminans]AGA69482.1 inhibitor of the KinA pathway to sporulation, predicted exonuclease [Desulfitobacterium dichloroeliminans LMG P-21439]